MRVPISRKHATIARLPEAPVYQKDHPSILGRPDHPASRLQDPIHSWIGISILEPVKIGMVVVGANQVSLQANLRQPHPHNNGPYQTIAGQVDAFAEDAAHKGETDHGFWTF